jgi:hypothetical protein
MTHPRAERFASYSEAKGFAGPISWNDRLNIREW